MYISYKKPKRTCRINDEVGFLVVAAAAAASTQSALGRRASSLSAGCWLPAAGPFSALDFDMWCMLFKHDFGENGMSGLHRDLSLSIGLAAMNRFTLGCPTDCIFITDSPVWNRVLYSRQSSEAGQYYSSTRLDAKVPTIFNLDVGRRRRRRKKGQKYCCKIREAIRVD